MKLYIIGPEDDGEGVYSIVSEKGEGLASHFCSHKRFAKSDLESRRPERQKEWKKKFGDYDVLFIGDDDMTEEKLRELNEGFNDEHKKEVTKDE